MDIKNIISKLQPTPKTRAKSLSIRVNEEVPVKLKAISKKFSVSQGKFITVIIEEFYRDLKAVK